jgi:hypothetical protein
VERTEHRFESEAGRDPLASTRNVAILYYSEAGTIAAVDEAEFHDPTASSIATLPVRVANIVQPQHATCGILAGASERFTSRLSLFASGSLATETTPDERRAEMTLDLYSELGQRQPHDNTTPPELSELVSAEERTDALYSRLREHLDNEGSTMSQQQVAEALKALDAALEDEAAALEPVLNRRLPSLERTRSVSEQADELIRKHGENPPS